MYRDDSTASKRPIPIGGDQLTCERIRGAHMARLDGDTPEERLEGLFCMVEDFHEKMNFLQVCFNEICCSMETSFTKHVCISQN